MLSALTLYSGHTGVPGCHDFPDVIELEDDTALGISAFGVRFSGGFLSGTLKFLHLCLFHSRT
jgi:hypothetical protein